MEKQYHELIAGRIYFGGANDMQQIADEENIALVVDLREESTGCTASKDGLQWKKIPLGDMAGAAQAVLFREAIQTVVTAYHAGQKVAFHCGGGKGRTGTVAAGVLLELGVCHSVAEAEAKAKAIRPVVNINADQHAALTTLYPAA